MADIQRLGWLNEYGALSLITVPKELLAHPCSDRKPQIREVIPLRLLKNWQQNCI
jgi:hypothetical protein